MSIDVRPLTLIFGKNNSGKSAILRLPRLLLRTLSSRQRRGFPLVVDGLSYGRVFNELIHGGDRNGNTEFSMVLDREGGQRLDLRTTVQNIQGESADFSVVSRFQLAGSMTLDWRWEPAASEVATYKGVGKVPFRGLLPDPRSGEPGHSFRSQLDIWREEVTALEDQLEHLGPLRVVTKRVNEVGPSAPLDFYGEGAINQMVYNSPLLTAVGAWYQQNLEGWRFDLSRLGNLVEPVLKRGGTTVSLADGGQGMQHLLPVVVQQLRCQLDDQKSFLNLVEEPELHLHAAAHAALGDLFLDTAKTGRGQTIVETHSENLLLRIRRRIAEGQDPELVALYWVGDLPNGSSDIRRINILKNGEVNWWPAGVFSEGYQEVRHLRRAGRISAAGATP